jgi:hypothetical protein
MSNEELEKKMRLSANKATIARDQEAEKQQQEQLDLAGKNSPFTQLDDVGLSLFQKLNAKSPKAGNLFLELAKHMDYKGAVICSRETLASLAGTDKSNVAKLIKLLHDYGLLKKFQSKGLPVYAMNQEVVWRSRGDGKAYALFNANVIMAKEEYEEDQDYDIRRANALLEIAKRPKGKPSSKTNDQPELAPPVGEHPEQIEIVD